MYKRPIEPKYKTIADKRFAKDVMGRKYDVRASTIDMVVSFKLYCKAYNGLRGRQSYIVKNYRGR